MDSEDLGDPQVKEWKAPEQNRQVCKLQAATCRGSKCVAHACNYLKVDCICNLIKPDFKRQIPLASKESRVGRVGTRLFLLLMPPVGEAGT